MNSPNGKIGNRQIRAGLSFLGICGDMYGKTSEGPQAGSGQQALKILSRSPNDYCRR
jgi:hypothetical protein